MTIKANHLTTEEAKLHARQPTRRKFFEWCAARGLKPVSRNRYSRSDLDRGLHEEPKISKFPSAEIIAINSAAKMEDAP